MLRRLELRRLELLLLAALVRFVGKQRTEPATWHPCWGKGQAAAVALMHQLALELLSARRRLDLRNTVARQWFRKVLLARRRLVG